MRPDDEEECGGVGYLFDDGFSMFMEGCYNVKSYFKGSYRDFYVAESFLLIHGLFVSAIDSFYIFI